jgi:ABC transporter substrate binding protein (PQQ-dependent alcohol dehydrogenase system)
MRPFIKILASSVIVLAAAAAAAQARETFSITYLIRDGDPYYAERRAYTGLELRQRHRPIDGARVALRESRILGRRLGLQLDLTERSLGDDESAVKAIDVELAAGGSGIVILDLPLDETVAVAEALSERDVLLLNVRHPDVVLRRSLCLPVLFHTLPSRAMTSDALAQYLRRKGWLKVLMLYGPEEADAATAAAFRHAAEKFGLEIVAERPFVLGNDPRQRDQTNVPLLTGEPDHDVVFVADTVGNFGRYVPFATYYPRPVVGTEGLVPSGWHWTWERHGAPQLNQRFDRVAGRRMVAEDWAAWAAVKSVVEAIVRTGSTTIEAIRTYLTSETFTLDTYKGNPGSFRPWSHQLRQPILLHTHDAVIERAPLSEFLHATNVLDTLGLDASETECEGAS